LKRYEYANGGYLTIDILEEEFSLENNPIIIERKKTPFELEVSSIKADIKHMDNLMEKLKENEKK